MARIERKVFYVGTWREDKVTDGTMRQIIARSLAEKGQRVKVKLSQDGLVLSKSVLLQESVLSRQVLQDVYFLTVNQRHPCCLLCIVADPVRKFLILALRTANPVEAQEIISTFKALKDNPTIDSGNVVLRRKDNGNWTLRERSQHNANRHLQQIFNDPANTAPPPTLTQPNGSLGGGDYVPVIDGSQVANQNRHPNYSLVPEDPSGGDVVVVAHPHSNHVDDLSQELQDVKFVVEKTGSVSSATLKSNTSHHYHHNNNNTEKSYYIETEVLTPKPEPTVNNNGVIHVYSTTTPPEPHDSRAGEVRAVVDDHRDYGIARAHSNGQPSSPAVVVRNGGLRHPITVPEPGVKTYTYTDSADPGTTNGYTEIPAYKIQRRVSTEYVQVPDFTGSHRVPQAGGSLRSSRVSFDPEVVLRRASHDPRRPFRSLRTPGFSGVPTTVVRPIEEVYGYAKPSILKPHVVGGGVGGGVVYVAPTQPIVLTQQPVYAVPHGGSTEVLTQPPHRRRSRPNSIHVMEGNELKVFHKAGHAHEDLLL